LSTSECFTLIATLDDSLDKNVQINLEET